MVGKNNPFNIRYSKNNKWQGQLGHTKGFVNFSFRVYGIRAAIYLLFRSYRRIGCDTIDKIIRRFAPSIENDTERYIQFVSNRCDISRNKILTTQEEYYKVLHHMSYFEGNPVYIDELAHCCDVFRLYLYDSTK